MLYFCPVINQQNKNEMKKLTLLVAVAAFAIASTSCKKEYACECTTTIFGTSSTATSAYSKLSKSEAKDHKTACEGSNTPGFVVCKQVTK
jgi:hypothetical protein